ncbi:MAG TPA: c-type cytochrome domain-containing protein [Pirellulales bacterium]|jgi:WD40 repeat protein
MLLQSFCLRLLFIAAICCGLSVAARADEAKPDAAKPGEKAQPKVTYEEHVQAIFRQHCFSCHGQDNPKSDLRTDNYAALMRGGASGEVIEPGDIDASRLWKLVSHEEAPEMPPSQDKLPEAALTTIKQWIAGGALEKSGSVAKMKAKPKVELAAAGGAGKPEGPPPMPEKLSRQPVVYTTRASAVTAIAASPWAPLVAIAGQKQILLYNTDNQQLLGVLPFTEGTPQILKFSRSGGLLLAGGGRGGQAGKVVVFDIRTGQRVVEVGDELDAVLAADINDDHTRIALGGPNRVVRIYSVEDGSVVNEIRKHTDWICSLEFSPDGALLATADRSGGMFVWEAETAREFQNLKGHTLGITAVSWRIDGNVLASSSEDGTIKLWEMDNGTVVKNWNAHPGGATWVNFARDGRLVSTGRDKLAKIWDQNGAAQKPLEAFGDIALRSVFTHDGARVVAGDWTGELRLSDTADGKLLGRLAANPPTLAMLVEAETARAAVAAAAAAQATVELAALEKSATEKTAAVTVAADRLKAAQAEAEKLSAEKAAADKALAEKAAAAKAATEAAAQASASAAQAAEEKATVEKAEAARAQAAKTEAAPPEAPK